ncbi:MAG: TolC family protein [Thermodesulfobacteriota bacterium]
MLRSAPLRILVLGVCASACAAVDPSASWQHVQGLARPATGATPVWQRSEADASAASEEARLLLADGMTREAAVRVALLSNPSLQATFEEVGIAQADLVQAGLPTNPQLSAVPTLPLSAGNSAAALLAFVSDLWLVPARRDVAEAEMDAKIRRVAAAVVLTASDAAKAYDEVLYREALLDVERTNRDIRAETAARTRKQLGSDPDDVAMLRTEAEAVQQELVVARAEKELASARLRLASVLGLEDPTSLPGLGDRFGPPPPDGWTTAGAVAFALEQRLDVAAARHDVAAAERQVALERRSVLGDVQLGPGYTGGLGTADSGGPALQMGLPVFDQNQAQIAKAEFQLRWREKRLRALESRVRREIADALADIAFYRRHVELYRTRLEPLQVDAVARADAAGARDDVFLLHALEARQEEVDGRRGYLEAVFELRSAQQRLHRALWAGSAS